MRESLLPEFLEGVAGGVASVEGGVYGEFFTFGV